MREFEALLPTISAFYGYLPEDVAQVRLHAMNNTQGGRQELALCVQQWRTDVVVNRLSGLADSVACRAWIQFRQTFMGMTTDENGLPYSRDILESAAPVKHSQAIEE